MKLQKLRPGRIKANGLLHNLRKNPLTFLPSNSFPMAAVPNYTNWVAENNTDLLFTSGGGKFRVGWQGCALSGGSREEFISLSSSFQGHLLSLAHGPLLHGQGQWWSIFFKSSSFLSLPSVTSASVLRLLSLILLPPSYPDPCDGIGMISQPKDHLPISISLIWSHLQSLCCHGR